VAVHGLFIVNFAHFSTLNFKLSKRRIHKELWHGVITLNDTLIIPDIRKTECFFYILCFEKTTTNTPSHGSKFDIALENYALRVQPTD